MFHPSFPFGTQRGTSAIESLETRLLFAAARTIDYFPIDPGLTWQYRCTSGDETYVADTCIRNKKSTLDGVKTSVMDSGEGGKTYYSFAEGVLREHKLCWNDEDGTSTARHDTPYALVPARLKVGATFENEGKWHGKTPEGVTWTGDVNHTLSVVKREDVKVPAGTFSALRIRLVKNENMNTVIGWSSTQTQDTTLWLAKDVGMVKAKFAEHEEYYRRGRLVSQEDMQTTQRLRKCSLPIVSISASVVSQLPRWTSVAQKSDRVDSPGNLAIVEQLLAAESQPGLI